MEKTLDIIAIGECLLELSTNQSFEKAETFTLSFGGDVLASAVAAKKLGSRVGIISSIGDDNFKNVILEKLNNQGFDISNIKICSEKNGLYLAGHSDKNELITYRRKVASNNLTLDDFNEEYINSSRAVYSSGITQSLSIQSNQLVKKIYQYAKENDILTAYDPNYTSSFMTAYDTKEYLEDIIENIDILFMSLKNDVEALYELTSVEKIVNYFTDYGVKIIVVKSHSDNGYYIHYNGNTEFCPFYNNNAVVSTMGAGDVFNGGFLSAVTNGYTPLEAAQIAAKQAGIYIDRLGQIKDIPTSEELLRL